MKPEEYQGIAALVIALGTAVAGIVTSRRTTKSEEKKPTTAPIPVVPPTPIPATPTEQQRFIESLLERLTAVEESNRRLEGVVRQMQEDQDFVHRREQTFAEALGRWLGRIARDFASRGAMMPLPDPDDMQTLRDIIPRG